MSRRIGVVMDPIEAITPKKDSTFAILLEAQKRAWPIFYIEQSDLYLENGRAFAHCCELTLEDRDVNWFSKQTKAVVALDSLDVIFMRLDPPFNTEYIYSTYILEQAEQVGTLVVNKPQSLRDANEKLFTAWFPQCCPPFLVTRNAEQIRAFLHKHLDIIIKPLDGMGGASIFRIKLHDPNLGVIIETLTDYGQRFAIVQLFIPEIKQGDKRILMIDGEPIAYGLARIPPPGETRGNLAVGGKGEGRALTEREYWICQQVGPVLKNKGLILTGLDVIGDYLTEINVTSPTCIRELDNLYGLNISGQLLDCIDKKLDCIDRKPA